MTFQSVYTKRKKMASGLSISLRSTEVGNRERDKPERSSFCQGAISIQVRNSSRQHGGNSLSECTDCDCRHQFDQLPTRSIGKFRAHTPGDINPALLRLQQSLAQ
jgi:hypothetical protein